MKDKYIEVNSSIACEPGTKKYTRGSLIIMVSPPYKDQGWHMSISNRSRLPSWIDVRDAWYGLVPGANEMEGHLVLPRKAEYINLHNFCLHVYQSTTKN